MSADGDEQLDWARTVVDALSAAGVTRFVVSPGSRSTPLALAVVAAGADYEVVVDERSAAFFALGCSRRDGSICALVCTSGTAGAHYLPAVCEAFEARVPLIVLTADRPAEHQHTGASQTTRQDDLFGSHVVWSADVGAPERSPLALRALAGRARRAALEAQTRRGPVHLNMPLRKPLEPSSWPPPPPADARPTGPMTWAPSRRAPDAAIATVAGLVDGAARGAIVVGPIVAADAAATETLRELAAATGFVLVPESTSQLRDRRSTTLAGDAYARFTGCSFAASDADLPTPDVVLLAGAPPVGAAVQRWAAAPRAAQVVLAEDGWPDPDSRADVICFGDLADTCGRLAAATAQRSASRTAFAAALASFDERVWAAVREVCFDADDALGDATLVRAVVSALPDAGLLFVGNSLPVRELDAFCDALPNAVGVVSQRGVAGIDGNIAQTVGLARRGAPPITALIGDVTFAHDAGSLALAALAVAPVAIVVVANGGGRIFDRLPVHAVAGASEVYGRIWTTAPTAAPADVARGFGVRSTVVDSATGLRRAIEAAHAATGVTVIEARVDPSRVGADAAAVRAILARGPLPALPLLRDAADEERS